jgi:hypothetical protein
MLYGVFHAASDVLLKKYVNVFNVPTYGSKEEQKYSDFLKGQSVFFMGVLTYLPHHPAGPPTEHRQRRQRLLHMYECNIT